MASTSISSSQAASTSTLSNGSLLLFQNSAKETSRHRWTLSQSIPSGSIQDANKAHFTIHWTGLLILFFKDFCNSFLLAKGL